MTAKAELEGPIARIVERAEALAAGAQSREELDRIAAVRARIRAEHLKHTSLINAAEHSTTIFTAPSHTLRNPTAWHEDPEPPIEGLPDGVTASYQVAPAVNGYHGCNIRIRLAAEGAGDVDEGELAYAGHFASPASFTQGDQMMEFDTAVIDPSTGQLLDSESESFALVTRAVGLVTDGEREREAARGVPAGYA